MTLANLRDFATSQGGAAYAAVCDRWRVDPAGFMDDPYLAVQLRAALAVATAPKESVQQADPFAETRSKSEELMRAYG